MYGEKGEKGGVVKEEEGRKVKGTESRKLKPLHFIPLAIPLSSYFSIPLSLYPSTLVMPIRRRHFCSFIPSLVRIWITSWSPSLILSGRSEQDSNLLQTIYLLFNDLLRTKINDNQHVFIIHISPQLISDIMMGQSKMNERYIGLSVTLIKR